jgi:hypothetical protein
VHFGQEVQRRDGLIAIDSKDFTLDGQGSPGFRDRFGQLARAAERLGPLDVTVALPQALPPRGS